jgi:hypothetical protein
MTALRRRDFVDLTSPFTVGHSARVAEHDLGRLSVSLAAWEQVGRAGDGPASTGSPHERMLSELGLAPAS